MQTRVSWPTQGCPLFCGNLGRRELLARTRAIFDCPPPSFSIAARRLGFRPPRPYFAHSSRSKAVAPVVGRWLGPLPWINRASSSFPAASSSPAVGSQLTRRWLRCLAGKRFFFEPINSWGYLHYPNLFSRVSNMFDFIDLARFC
jgi:hypothetical protein